MDTKHNVSDAELAEEQEALSAPKEDDVRSKIIADLGIEDDDSNKELVDRLVQRDVEKNNKLFKAIGQKIALRDQLAGKVSPKPSPVKVNMTNAEILDEARKAAREEYQQRDLDGMNHSDRVINEIKRIAEIQNVSVLKAAEDPYIKSMIEGETRQKSIDDAAANGKGRTKIGVVVDVSKPLDVANFDLSTEEGRTEWKEAKQAKRDALK